MPTGLAYVVSWMPAPIAFISGVVLAAQAAGGKPGAQIVADQ